MHTTQATQGGGLRRQCDCPQDLEPSTRGLVQEIGIVCKCNWSSTCPGYLYANVTGLLRARGTTYLYIQQLCAHTAVVWFVLDEDRTYSSCCCCLFVVQQ